MMAVPAVLALSPAAALADEGGPAPVAAAEADGMTGERAAAIAGAVFLLGAMAQRNERERR